MRRFSQQNPYRLVISDMRLGLRDGYELIADIREATEYSSSAFAILTGSNDPRDIERVTAADISYFHKPWSIGEWQNLVKDICQIVEMSK